MKKKWLIFLVVILFLIGFIFTFFLASFFTKNSIPKSEYKKANLTVRNTIYKVEVADTTKLRTQGLSGRKKLNNNSGMLFLFPYPDFYRFWMKDMNFPLDFIWINGLKIIDITENVPIPSPGTKLSTFTSRFPADKILEIPAGAVKNNNIKIGDIVKIEYL